MFPEPLTYKTAAESLFKAASKIDAQVFDGYVRAINWYVENLERHPRCHLEP